MTGRMASRCLVCTCALVGLLATGCQPKSPLISFHQVSKLPKARAYSRTLSHWTRHQVITIIEDLNTTARIYATIHAPEFNAAYAAKRRQMFRLTDREVQQLQAELAERWKSSYPLVVALATHDRDWNDLAAKDSHWRLHLLNDRGGVVTPNSIERHKRVTDIDKELFPFVDHFYELYLVRFPKTLPDGTPLANSQTRQLTLQVSGPLGRTELRWRLK